MMGRIMGRGERKELLSEEYHFILWRGRVQVCTAADGSDFLVFIDDVTANNSCRMNSEVHRVMLSAHIQPNG